MRFYRLALEMYATGVKTARATRLTKLMRWSLGPVAGRIVYRLSPNGRLPLEINGQKMFLAASGRYPPIDMALGRYEPETTRLFERLLAPGMVVVDVGGHVGYFSLLAARLVGPEGKVFTFEPEPTNYGLLLKNIELNGHKNIDAVNSAVSNSVGTLNLHLIGLDSGRHSTYHHPNLPEQGTLTVSATTLDAFLEGRGWPRVDLVKVDVEGAEMDVLNGMRQLLGKSGIIKLILEFKPTLLRSAGVDPEQFLDNLKEWGFNVRCIDEDKGLSPIEGVNVKSMIHALFSNDTSINLYCFKE